MFRNIICILAAIILIAFPVLAEDNFTKAENFIKIGRLGDAIQALEAQIALKSDDAEAYFMLGDIYLRTNNFAGADREFQAAITFRSAYRAEIGKKFYSAGLTLLNKGEVDWAKDLFQRTLKLDPAQAKAIATACLTAAKRYFAVSQPEKAEKLLPLILSDKASSALYQAERTKYGEKVLAEAKKELSEEKRQIAIRYLGQEKVNAEFPPKQWVVVFSKEYIGKGYDDNDSKQYHIPTIKYEELVRKGDKIILKTSGEFRIWFGRWRTYPGSYEAINDEEKPEGILFIEVKQDEKVILEIQRFMYPNGKEKITALSLN